MERKPLVINAYIDTRAGHVKQTRGLIQALSEFTPVEVTDMVLPEYGFWQSFFDWVIYILSVFRKEFKKDPVGASDLIIGTGSHTHIPMLLQKNKTGGRVITCMTPDWPLKKYMDLCFIPEHDSPRGMDNVFITLGPPNTAVDFHSHDSSRGLIVVGGKDKKTHHWHNEKVILQIRWILKTQTDITWTISTSPRTPKSMTTLLKEMAKDFPGMVFIPFKKTPSGWIEAQYALSKFAWVTADSVSMVYEALSAGCLVGILSVDWKKAENKLARAIRLLEKKIKIVTYENFKCKPGYPEYCVMNEAQRCAEEILKRWWPDRLQ